MAASLKTPSTAETARAAHVFRVRIPGCPAVRLSMASPYNHGSRNTVDGPAAIDRQADAGNVVVLQEEYDRIGHVFGASFPT